MEIQLTLKKYIDKNKILVIPHYQRGYVWGKGLKSDNAVSYMLKSIKEGLEKKESIFLQGITVSEDEQITLIDGQQRTTFLYLVLCYLESAKDIEIRYEVRQESELFLTELKNKTKNEIIEGSARDDNEPFQDLFFFKRSLRYIHEELQNIDRDNLKDYLLNNINFLYINIPLEKAIKTFTMMNGGKADMLDEELIKAELLRQISLKGKKIDVSEESWKTNALRSRYAREWDKWLHWWRKEEVAKLFKTEAQLGWLLECFVKEEGIKESSFENFKTLLQDSRSTKMHFKTLRRLQKSFEDIFNNAIICNCLGISLIQTHDRNEQYKIIKYFLKNKQNEELLTDFAKWRVVGATHDEIVGKIVDEKNKSKDAEKNVSEPKVQKAEDALEAISQKVVYGGEGDGVARKYLLYLNVLEDNRANKKEGKDIGRKFNFAIFENQSLEHIYPKSKVFHYNKESGRYYNGNDADLGVQKPSEVERLNRDDFPAGVSEHSIGNLVLLEGKNNSAFGDKTFSEKKRKYFDLSTSFESRELLHTISVFANNKWDMEEIVKNQESVISRFKQIYGVQ